MELFGLHIPNNLFCTGLVFVCIFLFGILVGLLWDWNKWKWYLASVLISSGLLSFVPFLFLFLIAPLTLVIVNLVGRWRKLSFSSTEYLFMALFSYVIVWLLSIILLLIRVEVFGLPLHY